MSKKAKKQTECVVSNTENLMFQQFPTVGKTICSLYSNPLAFLEVADNLFDETKYLLFGVDEKTGSDSLMKLTYTGVAKVNSECGDTYDANEGREVAKSKAVAKFRRDMQNKLCDLLADLYRAVASVEHYMDKHGYAYNDVPDVQNIKMTKYRDAYRN